MNEFFWSLLIFGPVYLYSDHTAKYGCGLVCDVNRLTMHTHPLCEKFLCAFFSTVLACFSAVVSHASWIGWSAGVHKSGVDNPTLICVYIIFWRKVYANLCIVVLYQVTSHHYNVLLLQLASVWWALCTFYIHFVQFHILRKIWCNYNNLSLTLNCLRCDWWCAHSRWSQYSSIS